MNKYLEGQSNTTNKVDLTDVKLLKSPGTFTKTDQSKFCITEEM